MSIRSVEDNRPNGYSLRITSPQHYPLRTQMIMATINAGNTDLPQPWLRLSMALPDRIEQPCGSQLRISFDARTPTGDRDGHRHSGFAISYSGANCSVATNVVGRGRTGLPQWSGRHPVPPHR